MTMLRKVVQAALAGAFGAVLMLGVSAIVSVEPQGTELPQPTPTPDIEYINDPDR